MRVTLGGLKGGIAKSTSAIYIALGLAAQGERVLLVDADPQAATVLDWSTAAGDAWPERVVVVPWPTPDLAKRVTQVAKDYDSVVIDTGGESDVILGQALMVSDELVIPTAPALAELRRLPATFELAARIDAVSPLSARVLLTKVRAGTNSAREARELLEQQGFPVMAAEVGLRERYAQSFGTVPSDIGEYAQVLAELQAPEAVEVAS